MELIDFILHFDEHLKNIINSLGSLTYVILFIIVFAETGLVVTPFLPGDSLLFAVGAVSASTGLNFWIAYITLLIAAILGDSVNYWIGNKIGPRVFAKENSRVFKKAYLEKTREFYAKHGGKTIILARFVPIVRTFAPFVAGVGKMHYSTFISYNVIGGFIWVTSLMVLGRLFGSIPVVEKNFEYVIIGIILFSLLPMVYEYINHKKNEKKEEKKAAGLDYEDIQKTFKKEHLKD
jgi:membrane-associated protein